MMPFITLQQVQEVFSPLKLNITKKIGSGGFKEVFEAFDTNGQHLALKVLDPDETDLNRLLREARAMKDIDSPYVAILEDWGLGETTQLPFLLEHFIEGAPLDVVLQQGKLYSPEELRFFLDCALQGLSACAEKKIVHRDIKPQNIMVTENGIPIIIDFGISRHVSLTSLTATGGSAGFTPRYAPPEVLEYKKRAHNETTDLFSMGIVAYEMLTGAHPFLTNHRIPMQFGDIKDKMINEEAIPPHKRDSSIPVTISKYIMTLLRRDRIDRFRSVDFALERLRTIELN